MHINGTSALYIYLFVVISWLEYCQNEYPRWIPLQYKWSIDRAGLYSSLRLACSKESYDLSEALNAYLGHDILACRIRSLAAAANINS